MFGIGMPEMVVIVVLALVVLGPKRLPEVARALGKGLAEFRKVTGDVNKELEAARSMIEAEAREHENARRREARERALAEATARAAAGATPAATGDPQATADAGAVGAATAVAGATADGVANSPDTDRKA